MLNSHFDLDVARSKVWKRVFDHKLLQFTRLPQIALVARARVCQPAFKFIVLTLYRSNVVALLVAKWLPPMCCNQLCLVVITLRAVDFFAVLAKGSRCQGFWWITLLPFEVIRWIGFYFSVS
jgi:hypothetical protein